MDQPLTIPQAMKNAFQLHDAGRLADAEKIYRQVLARNPNHADAVHGLGVIAQQLGKADLALQFYQRAISLNPNNTNYQSNLAAAMQSLGRRDEAIACNRRVVAIDPANATAWTNLGNWLQQAGQMDQALAACRRAIAIDPAIPDAHNNLGLVLSAMGNQDAAIESYRAALHLRPDFPEALNNLAGVLLTKDETAEASALSRRAIELRPNFSSAFINLGYIFQKSNDLDAAINTYRRAIALEPNSAEAYSNLGFALLERGLVDESIEACHNAMRLRHDFPEAMINLGNALRNKGDYPQAIALFQRAAELRPDSYQAFNNLAVCLLGAGMVDEAAQACRTALKIRPQDESTLNNLGNILQSQANHTAAAECFNRAVAIDPTDVGIASNRLLTLHYLPGMGREEIFHEHRKWAALHADDLGRNAAPHQNDPSPDRVLRIGYVSGDLIHHSVGFFLLPVLRAHDRSKVHVTCYSTSARQDSVTPILRAAADRWVNIVPLSDAEAAEQIRRDQIDILVDLSGHTAFNRLLVFARKPAPVQVAWLGYPDTTGMTAMNWRLTDAIADPQGAEAFHTEKLLRLPNSAWCFHPLSGSPPVLPSPRSHVVFGSFNNTPKINAPLVAMWAAILRQVPDSRLVLKNRSTTSATFRAWLRENLESLGVPWDRIELLGRHAANEEHLQSYEKIGIALDTFPYHGTTTTCESLWMGVPVITLTGETHASRVGVSLLTTVGLSNLIAATQDDYIRLAVELATDRPRLAELRATLRDRMQSSPLMDVKQFTTNLEAAYRRIWIERVASA